MTVWDTTTDDIQLAAILELRNKLAPRVFFSRFNPVKQDQGTRVMVEIEGTIKPPTDSRSLAGMTLFTKPPEHQRARAERETLYRQAEDTITAAEELGFQHVKHPEIETAGCVIRVGTSPELQLSPQVTIRLWLEVPRT